MNNKKTFYIQGSFWYEGSKVRINHEGHFVGEGLLFDAWEERNLVCIKREDGTKYWAHESFCTRIQE